MGRPDPGKEPQGPVPPGLVLRDPVHWLSFGLGTGLLPRAPGTWASAATALAYWLLPAPGFALHLALVAALFLAGIWICGASERRLGRADHSGIVFDEIVGMLATLLFVPPGGWWIVLAFLLFRVMDIAKPWPIREFDHRLSGGLGIMLDDVLAAVYAVLGMLAVELLLTFIP
jgi:phosphatidylglycerophosphatase A